MKFDMIVSGVGGQGILSISFVLDNAALQEGLRFKQSEVHGMAQRGGAVLSHLRISDREIFSDLTPIGGADLILSMEPLETLRYLRYRAPEGAVVSSVSPFINIPNYPELDEVIEQLLAVPNHTLVNSAELARAAGSHYAQNMVMLGAASSLIPVENKSMEKFIGVLFKAKGETVINININAFRAGARAGAFHHGLRTGGLTPREAAVIATSLEAGDYGAEGVADWRELCSRPEADRLLKWLHSRKGLLPGDETVVKALAALDFPRAATQDFESCLAEFAHNNGD